MLERTDIIGIRNTVKSFIYLDPEPIEECPFLVSHPIFDSNVMTFRDDDKVYEFCRKTNKESNNKNIKAYK